MLRRRRLGPRRLDGFELGALGLMAALSLWVIASDLVEAAVRHQVWTHTDGFFSGDQLQYLAWIRSSAAHGLVSDLFVLRHTPADYAQPAIILSGLLVRLGVAPWLTLMLWKPVAVVATVLAVRALVDHCFTRTFDRRAALVLGLFFASLTDVNGSVGVFGDMISMWQSWGYPFGLIGVALITFGLLGYARARDTGTVSLLPGLCGALAGTVHPWQGELMFLVLGLAELIRAPRTLAGWRSGGMRRDPTLRLAVLTLVLVGIPLLYYFGLGHLDPAWRMGQAHARHTFSSTSVLIAAAPLLAFALLGYRGRPADFLELTLRLWPVAALIIWVFSLTALGATPQHAVNGLPLPMAVLAVLGVRRVGLDRLPHGRLLAVLGVAAATIPGTAYTLAYAHTFIAPARGNANFVAPGENRALAWLDRAPIPGGVLTDYALGAAVPGLTGRTTFVGNCLWSQPNCPARRHMVGALFSGALAPGPARRFVERSGARFVLGPCGDPPGAVERALGPLIRATRRFGCATVWQLRPSGPPRGPLAGVGASSLPGNMTSYASVRTPWRQ